jgi:CRP-like cAMP-binding protein
MYDSTGALASKSGTIDYRQWYRQAFGASTPWGDVDRDVVTGELESPLERAVSTHIMQGDAKIKKLKAGHTLIHQGEDSSEMYLLLDGVVSVVVDDATVAELGPGAVLGERATVEGGHRTATITARTRCRLAVTSPETLAADVRHALASGHRREDERTT